MPFARCVKRVGRVLDVVARIAFFHVLRNGAGECDQVIGFVQAANVLAKVDPFVQRNQFNAAANPFLFNVAVAVFQLHRIEVEIFAIGQEIALVRRARSALALAIDEQLAKVPCPFTDLRHGGLPPAGFAFDFLPASDSPTAAQHRLLVAIRCDDEWLVRAAAGIFRAQYNGLGDGIRTAAQKNGGPLERWFGALAGYACGFQRRR